MSTRLTIKTILALVLTFGASGVVRAQTTGTCSLQTLDGTYVFATHGWNIVNGAAAPKAIVEEIEFNGDGTLTSPFATVSINGTILHFSGGAGTYTLQSNCTGTLSFTNGITFDIVVDPPPPPSHQTFSKHLWMIQTHDPSGASPVFEGEVTRVSR
ncbi:MAG TPA: hypothetical protein VE758_01250 [Chthoniobacterales bacterium]|nr:hypothetical protein [Chthoniobacterales bacterium]